MCRNVGECRSEHNHKILSYATTQEHPDADPMADTCGTCARHADLVQFGESIKGLESLVLQARDFFPPSLKGLPVAVPGTVAPGTYTTQVLVTNWLDQSSMSAMTFKTSTLQPMIYLEGALERSMYSDKELVLSAIASSAWCYPGGVSTEVLKYEWSMTCHDGPCLLSLPLEHMADSVNSRFLRIPPGRLTGACTYVLTCTTTQDSVSRKASIAAIVHVLVRPIEARLSGVSDDGIVSSDINTVISIADSWDPEQATTGLSASHLLATWHVEEIEEQAYCSLADAPTPQVGGVWDSCPMGSSKDSRPGVFYPITAATPSIALNATMLTAGTRLRVTVTLRRDLDKLPAGMRQAQTGWNISEIEQWFGATAVWSVKFDLEAGLQWYVKVAPCDYTLLGQPEACTHKSSTVDGKVVNAWRVTIDRPAGLLHANDIEYDWYIDRPLLSFLIPPSSRRRLRPPQLSNSSSTTRRGGRSGRKRPPVWEAAHLRRQHALIRAQQRPNSAGIEEAHLRIHGKPVTYMLSPECQGTSCHVVINRGAIIAGQLYLIKLTVHDDRLHQHQHQYASLIVPSLTPPSGGSLTVFPSEGTAVSSLFEVRADGWATDEDSLPLTYDLIAINWNFGTENLMKRSQLNTAILPLGVGNPGNGHLLELLVRVIDLNGAFARASNPTSPRWAARDGDAR
jgi:hypothetical protein